MNQSPIEISKHDPVYVVTFYDNSRSTVDSYFDLIMPELLAHIEKTSIDCPFLLVLDISQSGMFSLHYANQRMTSAFADFEQLPVLFIAYLTSDMHDKILVEMMNSLTARKIAHTRQIFPANGLDSALAWLMSKLD